MITYDQFLEIPRHERGDALANIREKYSNDAICQFWNIKLPQYYKMIHEYNVPRRRRAGDDTPEETINPSEYGFNIPSQEDPESASPPPPKTGQQGAKRGDTRRREPKQEKQRPPVYEEDQDEPVPPRGPFIDIEAHRVIEIPEIQPDYKQLIDIESEDHSVSIGQQLKAAATLAEMSKGTLKVRIQVWKKD